MLKSIESSKFCFLINQLIKNGFFPVLYVKGIPDSLTLQQYFSYLQASSNTDVVNCLKLKKQTNFKSSIQLIKGTPFINSPKVELIIGYKSKEKTIHEEVLVHDAADMVAQIGGISSLFLGFSFFGLLSDFLDFLRENMPSKHRSVAVGN